MAVSGAQAQQPGTTQQRPGTMPGNMNGPEIEGRVRDVKGVLITLSDGTQLTVPKG